MSGFNPPPTDNSPATDDLTLRQRIATTFGVDPFSLTDAQFKQYVMLLNIADATAKHPNWTQLSPNYWQDADGTIWELTQDSKDNIDFTHHTTKAEINNILGSIDQGGGAADGGGSGGGGSTQRLASDDPRYWDLQYQQLYQQALNTGLDAESARRQALATLITNRNAQSVNLAQTSGDIAAKAAQFAANPRDAVADLMYRNAIGGSTPYGSTGNAAFGDLQNGLQNKFQELFGGVAGDLSRARDFISAPPPAEFLQPASNIPGINTNTTLPATSDYGQMPGGQAPQQAPAPQMNGLSALIDKLNSFDPQQKDAFVKWVTAANGGAPPATAEGGINLNIAEPAMVVGIHSGRVYTTLAEKDPEQLIVKPLQSTMERMKQQKQSAQKSQNGIPMMEGGGTASVIPNVDDFMTQLRTNLSRLGGQGGGVGAGNDPLNNLRLLAGAPESMMDPDLRQYLYAAESARGISPDTVDFTLKRYSPQAIQNNLPRISF